MRVRELDTRRRQMVANHGFPYRAYVRAHDSHRTHLDSETSRHGELCLPQNIPLMNDGGFQLCVTQRHRGASSWWSLTAPHPRRALCSWPSSLQGSSPAVSCLAMPRISHKGEPPEGSGILEAEVFSSCPLIFALDPTVRFLCCNVGV